MKVKITQAVIYTFNKHVTPGWLLLAIKYIYGGNSGGFQWDVKPEYDIHSIQNIIYKSYAHTLSMNAI